MLAYFFNKHFQKTSLPAVGYHEHARYAGIHPISQNHRFQHRQVGEQDEFTVPEKYWEGEEDPEKLTSISISSVARAHRIDPSSLSRALKTSKTGISDQQLIEREYYDENGQYRRMKEILLTPAQVGIAHKIAAEVKRNSLSRSRPMRRITNMFKMFIEENTRGL